jgi:hypothetical protein
VGDGLKKKEKTSGVLDKDRQDRQVRPHKGDFISAVT